MQDHLNSSPEAGAATAERWPGTTADPGEFAIWLAESGIPYVCVTSRVVPAAPVQDGWSTSVDRELLIQLLQAEDVARVADALNLGSLDVTITLMEDHGVTHELHRSGAWGFFCRVDLVVVLGVDE